MHKAMLFISTVSLAIVAGGTLETSYKDGIIGNVIAAKPVTEPTYSLVQNVKEDDGWHAYVRDYGMTLEDCTAAMHGMRRGRAGGGGYDRTTAAVEQAIERMGGGDTRPEAQAHVDAIKAAMGGQDGKRWAQRVEDAGYIVQHVFG